MLGFGPPSLHCVSCGSESPTHAAFCSNCGSSLADAVRKARLVGRTPPRRPPAGADGPWDVGGVKRHSPERNAEASGHSDSTGGGTNPCPACGSMEAKADSAEEGRSGRVERAELALNTFGIHGLLKTAKCSSCPCIWKSSHGTPRLPLFVFAVVLVGVGGIFLICPSLAGGSKAWYHDALALLCFIAGVNFACAFILLAFADTKSNAIFDITDELVENESAKALRYKFALITGYSYGLAALFIFPPFMALMGVGIGIANIRAGHRKHGTAQIVIAIVFGLVGFLGGIVVGLELTG